MGALTEDRKTPRREGEIYEYPVKAATKVFGGAITCLDANGYAVPGSDTAGLKVVGVSEDRADNSAGANAAINVKVREGVFQFVSSSLTIADIGKAMYVSDDQTVTKTATTNKVMAGILVAIEGATKAWVDIGANARMGQVVAAVSQADASAPGATYDQAEVTSIADLANANKVAINALIASLKAANQIGS